MLDRQVAGLLKTFANQAAASSTDVLPGMEAMRAAAARIFKEFAGPIEAACATQDMRIPGPGGDIPLRLYRPPAVAQGSAPTVVFLHGGGWSVGDIDSYDGLMHALCAQSGATFVSVEYRLAPEHKFPAGLEDALAAVKWAASEIGALGGDPARLAVMGDSAGGNLAAVVAMLLRGGDVRIAAQILLYPMLDISTPHTAYKSRMQFGSGDFFLSRENIDAAAAWYLDDTHQPQDPRISPLCADDFHGLPPTILFAAGCDPLCDEARRFVDRLNRDGTAVTFECFPGVIHAFLSFGVLDISQRGRRLLAERIARIEPQLLKRSIYGA